MVESSLYLLLLFFEIALSQITCEHHPGREGKRHFLLLEILTDSAYRRAHVFHVRTTAAILSVYVISVAVSLHQRFDVCLRVLVVNIFDVVVPRILSYI